MRLNLQVLRELDEDRLQSRTVRIPVENVTLTGDLDIPRAARGLVLFAHGSGSSRYSPRNRAVAATLREAGLATLLFDLLSPEEEEKDEFTAQFRFDIELLARRLTVVTKEVADDPECRSLGLGYFGASTGAAAALIAAAAHGSRVQAVVSRGGRPDLADDVLSEVTAATLLIVGERDAEVRRLNQLAFEKMRCQKSLAVIRQATHLFEERGALDEVAHLAADWFNQHLKEHR